MMNRSSDPTAKSIGLATRRLSADTKERNTESIRRLVQIQPQVHSINSMRDIPGARRRKIVPRKLMVETMLDAMSNMSASSIIEPPTCGLNSTVMSGAYVVHPQSAVPPLAKKLDKASRPLER